MEVENNPVEVKVEVENPIEGLTEADTQKDENIKDEAEDTSVEKWKNLSRKNEADKKAALTEIDALKSEIENLKKAQDELNEVKAKNLELIKSSLVKESGLPEKILEKINGVTEEEIKKDIDFYKEIYPTKPITSVKPDPHQGGLNSDNAKPKKLTKEEHAARMASK